MDVNFWGTVRVMEEALPLMPTEGARAPAPAPRLPACARPPGACRWGPCMGRHVRQRCRQSLFMLPS